MQPSKEFVQEWTERPEHMRVISAAINVLQKAGYRWKVWSIAMWSLLACQLGALAYELILLDEIPGAASLHLPFPWMICVFLALIPCFRYGRHRRLAANVLMGMENAMVAEYRNALGGTGVR